MYQPYSTPYSSNLALGELAQYRCLSAINKDVRDVQQAFFSGGLVRFRLSFSISSRCWFSGRSYDYTRDGRYGTLPHIALIELALRLITSTPGMKKKVVRGMEIQAIAGVSRLFSPCGNHCFPKHLRYCLMNALPLLHSSPSAAVCCCCAVLLLCVRFGKGPHWRNHHHP